MTATARVDPAELRNVTVLADATDDDLAWLAERVDVVTLAPGEPLFTAGDPASWMYLVLEGELHGRREQLGPEAPVFRVRAGDVSGMLPFSRMREFVGTGRAITPARVARYPAAGFRDLLARMPVLEERLVATMADRVRETTRIDQQTEKLMALGKLAAGLAHELNNPAAAARRAATDLRGRLARLEEFTIALAAACAEPSAVRTLDLARRRAAGRLGQPSTVDALDRSDREDELSTWLSGAGVSDGWEVAPTFADFGLTVAELDEATRALPAPAREAAVRWLDAALAADALLAAVEGAAGRISALVGAVKSYTHVDRAHVRAEVDVREGLESTLAMLTHKLREKRVVVERDYGPSLPLISAFGGELNQVWTNLLDNAIDAVAAGGRVVVRARHDGAALVVEVCDDGPGIPAAVRDRIWEPFYTTKEVGQGTGLGLDIARRIVVRQHGGEIDLASEPGATRFTVRLPTAGDAVYETTPIEEEGAL